MKYKAKLLTRKCDGFCGNSFPHQFDLTFVGKFVFDWRFRLLDALYPDPRPQPTITETGSDWWADYKGKWENKFHVECPSRWVREKRGFWVWCTVTPQFDRDYFDSKGWRFPVKWITVPSMKFYEVGKDDLSDIVSLPDGS